MLRHQRLLTPSVTPSSSELGAQSFGFGAWDLGFRGLGFKGLGLGSRVGAAGVLRHQRLLTPKRHANATSSLGLGAWGSGLRGLGCRVWDVGSGAANRQIGTCISERSLLFSIRTSEISIAAP
eukprot:2113198-Rhodomonas_salina.2